MTTIHHPNRLLEHAKAVMANMPVLGPPAFPPTDKPVTSLYKRLKALAHHDEYYVALNLNSPTGLPEVLWQVGVERCLGYSNEEWSFLKMLEIIHGLHFERYIQLAGHIYEVFSQMTERLEFLKQRYIVNIPVQKNNEKFVWVKQMSMPLKMDANGRMIHQLNCYTIIGGYKALKRLPEDPRLFLKNGRRARKLESDLFMRLKETATANLLTKRELDIYRAYWKVLAELTEAEKELSIKKWGYELTKKNFAIKAEEILAISEDGIESHIKNIKIKLEMALHKEYGRFQEAFEELKRMGY